MEWLHSIGPANVKLLRDISAGLFSKHTHWEDPCPASSFALAARKHGVDLPRNILTGYAFGYPPIPLHLRHKQWARKSATPRRWIKVIEPPLNDEKLPNVKEPCFMGHWNLVFQKSDSDVEDGAEF